MAFVRVEQRNAHLAGSVRLEFVNGREGKVAKGTLTAISNTRRGTGETREDEATAIQWTLWGKQAENAAEYLGKGSHVNVVGRLRNNNYEKDGEEVFALAFTCEEIDYLDSKGDAEARRARVDNGGNGNGNGNGNGSGNGSGNGAGADSSAGASQPEGGHADGASKPARSRRARTDADTREPTTA